ncbi:hypothetical protein OKW49_002757 [Paraburkholderia youngii]|uniref:hypothetical protein n=1 Tax=Paraburkholderia youngii TaxID=2782701 RepID=UPI003D22C9BC
MEPQNAGTCTGKLLENGSFSRRRATPRSRWARLAMHVPANILINTALGVGFAQWDALGERMSWQGIPSINRHFRKIENNLILRITALFRDFILKITNGSAGKFLLSATQRFFHFNLPAIVIIQ